MERMISRCFTWFPNCLVLGEPNIYHDSGVFYKYVGFYLEGVSLYRVSGGYTGVGRVNFQECWFYFKFWA